MNDQDLEAKIYDLLATDKNLIEIVDNIMGYVKQDRELYGIECRIDELNGITSQTSLLKLMSNLSDKCGGSVRDRIAELQTKKAKLEDDNHA